MSTPTAGGEFGELLDALRISVAGLTEPWPGGPLNNPDTTTGDAFAPHLPAQPVDVGGGLWAVLRVSPDRTSRVLCVHNISDQPVSFDPAPLLSATASSGADLRFVHGRVRTEQADDGTVLCHLEARSFVWLSNIIAAEDQTTGEPR